MAEHATRGHRPSGPGPSAPCWSSEQIADALVPRRDRFVAQISRELPSARGLTVDQCELVVDEAIDFMVTEYRRPVESLVSLERAFWATAGFRIRRMHEGRGATVRAGYQRVALDHVELQGQELDPEAAALQRAETEALLEFAATLSESERTVLVCKYGAEAEQLGRIAISRRLGLSIGEVRRAERSIARKLERFAAIMSAGTLCIHRDPAIAALAAGSASDEQVLAARVHLQTCPVCRAAYKERLRTDELARKLAELLPAPPLLAESRQRGAWDAVIDWASRPFAHDAPTAAQVIASGGGRGLGTLAAGKLVAICLAGATAIGGGALCINSGVFDGNGQPPERKAAEPRQSTKDVARLQKLPSPVSTAVATATPAPKRRVTRVRSTNPRRHETEVPISPAPAGALPGGASEFGPTSATGSAPPAVAPSSGGPEFP
jgi:hypothetical protein